MTELNITAASPVDDVMRGWPETIRAFLDHKTAKVKPNK